MLAGQVRGGICTMAKKRNGRQGKGAGGAEDAENFPGCPEKTQLLELLALSAHDMRQPLQAIELLGRALATSGSTGERHEINGYLQASLAALRKITSLTGDLAKIVNGHRRMRNQPLDLREFVGARQEMLNNLAACFGCFLL